MLCSLCNKHKGCRAITKSLGLKPKMLDRLTLEAKIADVNQLTGAVHGNEAEDLNSWKQDGYRTETEQDELYLAVLLIHSRVFRLLYGVGHREHDSNDGMHMKSGWGCRQ